jgi:putative transposase
VPRLFDQNVAARGQVVGIVCTGVAREVIVGWQLATHMRTELVLDALEMANGLRRPVADLIAHTDGGSQYTSVKYTDRIDELKIDPSVGSKGDAYDTQLMMAAVALRFAV